MDIWTYGIPIGEEDKSCCPAPNLILSVCLRKPRIPASVEGMTKKKDGPKWEMTPEEFAHLKRIH
jgi:hypothetical protein